MTIVIILGKVMTMESCVRAENEHFMTHKTTDL